MSKKREIKSREENIWNIPNPLSLLRIIISPFLVYLVFSGESIKTLVLLFVIAASTDFLDGYIARKYNQVTNIGRKLDIIADRTLMISLVVSILLYLDINNLITDKNMWFIILIMSREILSFPFMLISFIVKGRPMPHARITGKLMTLFQGITFPVIILGWAFALPFTIITCLTGIICTGYYAYDSTIKPQNSFQKNGDKYYKRLYS